MNRRHRLRGRGRFLALRRQGVEVRRGALRLRALATAAPFTRCGLAVMGTRSAVERNLVKRRLRELVRPRVAEAGGRDVLVAISAAAGGAPFTVLERDVRAAWAEMERRVQGSAVPS